MAQKAYTKYECATGNVGLGHSSLWTGARPSDKDESCMCGQPLIEVTPDGYSYKVEFETIDSFQAAEMEGRFGREIWSQLSDGEWNALRWCPVTSNEGTPNVLRDQYKRLLQWATSREQPIRNVRFFKAKAQPALEWEEVQQ